MTATATAILSAGEVTTVQGLVDDAREHDGFFALNEAAMMHLRHPRPGIVHLLLHRHAELVGYAQLDAHTSADTSDPLSEVLGFSTAQLVVAPADRRSGVGSALLAELLRTSSTRLRLWAMGNTVGARALAASHQLVPARQLLIMTRPLAEPVPEVHLPAGVTIRTFAVGHDEEAWLRVNARAFSHHPEQGQLTRADLADLISEPWFDAAGFFVAIRGDELTSETQTETETETDMVGFHWTKQHPGRLGEVYVLGVDPAAGGRGLGKALLGTGLGYLRERGNESVELYVEADHASAVALYAGYGFTESSRDVMYAQP